MFLFNLILKMCLVSFVRLHFRAIILIVKICIINFLVIFTTFILAICITLTNTRFQTDYGISLCSCLIFIYQINAMFDSCKFY